MINKRNPYAVIVFFSDGQKPKKWENVDKLNGFGMFLDKKHPSWQYMNVYDRKTRKYLKRFNRGVFIPASL